MKTRQKREIAATVCFAIAIAIGIQGLILPSAAGQPMFIDVPETHWAWSFIEELALVRRDRRLSCR